MTKANDFTGYIVNYQGSHASWTVLIFWGKTPTPGKSWKMILVLENLGNLS